MLSELQYNVVCFTLLGVQHILYFWIYHFPQRFIEICNNGSLGEGLKIMEYWQSFMAISLWLKTFTFGVVIYDVFVHQKNKFGLHIPINPNTTFLLLGIILFGTGQLLNSAVYKTLGAKGVYYGHQLGYTVDYVTAFPFNFGLSDPQYWGVILTYYGVYVMAGVDSFRVAYFATFWYLSSIVLLESPRGMVVMKALGLIRKDYKSVVKKMD